MHLEKQVRLSSFLGSRVGITESLIWADGKVVRWELTQDRFAALFKDGGVSNHPFSKMLMPDCDIDVAEAVQVESCDGVITRVDVAIPGTGTFRRRPRRAVN